MAKTQEKRLDVLEKKRKPQANIITIFNSALADWYDEKLGKLDPEDRLTEYQKLLDTKHKGVWGRIKPYIENMLDDWANPELGMREAEATVKPMTDKELEAWTKKQQLKRRLVYMYKRYGRTRLTDKDRKRFEVAVATKLKKKGSN